METLPQYIIDKDEKPENIWNNENNTMDNTMRNIYQRRLNRKSYILELEILS